MGLYSNYIVENNMISFNTDKDLTKYLDECFLINESANSGIQDLTNKIKSLTKKIEDEKLTDEEIKEEIQNIYDQAQIILKGATKDVKGAFFKAGSLILLCSAVVGLLIASAGVATSVAGISLLGSMLSTIGSLIFAFGAQSDYDKFYAILVRAESEMMRELRIAKQEGDKAKIKSCEKVIEIYEDLKSKRRTELNQRAHDQYNESADIVLEYMGNEIKTNDMIQTFADIDHYLKYEMETLKVYVDHVENMISLANSATKKNISEITKKCVDEGNKINDDVNKVRDTWLPMSDSMFRKQIKVFSNKYSKLGMEQREKFSNRLEKYLEDVNEIGNKYNKQSDMKERIDAASDKVKNIDYANGEKIIDLIYNWNDEGIIYQCNYIIKLCAYMIQSLNIKGIKSSLMYKIAGKFGK